ncbi:MAG: flagellar hook-associated protein FlgK [Desulfobacter sp.]|nr:MAG: flagellar hook-associated protein FlgK [Desulfobacter sp.]
MSGLYSTLSIAKTAIAAQQYGLSVTGNNIANVNNPDYSLQNVQQTNAQSTEYAGYIFGTGVDITEVSQSVDQLLENRLTTEISKQSSLEEAESYLAVIESLFDETSGSGLSSLINDYWDAWQDIADSPLGTSERVQVYDTGQALAAKFNSISSDLQDLEQDLNSEISATLTQINAITSQIADLNREILGLEATQTANDLRDTRNGLIDDLGQLIDIDVITQGDGAVLINGANGLPLVNGVDSSRIAADKDRIVWQGASSTLDITDKISGGKLAGWLTIRDEVLPTCMAQVDELASEMTWAVNYLHSQGAGLDYISDTSSGTYAADDSGWLSSLAFGDKIDYTKDFSLWVEDSSTSAAQYRQILMDMGISGAAASDWQGTAPGGESAAYRLTVVDEAAVGDLVVAQSSGEGQGEVRGIASGGVDQALDTVMAAQTLTLTGTGQGTQTIEITDTAAGTRRSAAAIAETLTGIDGVTAYASESQLAFDTGGMTAADEGDIVKFTLYCDGIEYQQSFTVDPSAGTLDQQFETALEEAAAAVNILNNDTDLYADDLVLKSDKGATLGIQDFEVVDNAGVLMDNFSNFNTGDVLTLTVSTDGAPTTSTDISVDLSSVIDPTDQAAMGAAFYQALSTGLAEGPFALDLDEDTGAVTLRTTDGSNLTLGAAAGDTGDDATLALTGLSGSVSGAGNGVLEFTAAGTDTETYTAASGTADTLDISMPGSGTAALAGTLVTLCEVGAPTGTADTAAVTTGSLTIYLEPGMTLYSDNATAAGLFGTSGTAATGASILTLGGTGGFGDFDDGDLVSFDVDGTTVSFTVSAAAGGTTDAGLARQIYNQLNTTITSPDYQFVLNGTSVSIIKDRDLEAPIELTNFTDNTSADASLSLFTGTGTGTDRPDNTLLVSGDPDKNFAVSSLYSDGGIILWEKLDSEGYFTGESGLIQVEDQGRVVIEEAGVETLSFDLSSGSLVAGNTLTVNTDGTGSPDLLNMEVFRRANGINDTYTFEVVSGGSVGLEGEEAPLTIQWTSSTGAGSFELVAEDPPKDPDVPIQVEVDGMLINFYSGTLFDGDVFTLTTDETGQATQTLMSDWHWTLTSFADEFNRNGSGMAATVTADNRLSLAADQDCHTLENVTWSGADGFSSDNGEITVLDWSALDFNATDLSFVRSSGAWGIVNDVTGGLAAIIPEGGDDRGFQVDLNGDGLGDLQVDFSSPVTGDGAVNFDLVLKDPADIGYAFGGLGEGDCGLAAAAGLNTFFTGTSALDIGVNEVLKDTERIAAGVVDSQTGAITTGSNETALDIADLAYTALEMTQTDFVRGEDALSGVTQASLNEYYNTMIASLGITSKSIISSRTFADTLVDQITAQRDAVSAVSLDEEMIKLTQYQHAYSAASKLLSVADEMLQTILSVR